PRPGGLTPRSSRLPATPQERPRAGRQGTAGEGTEKRADGWRWPAVRTGPHSFSRSGPRDTAGLTGPPPRGHMSGHRIWLRSLGPTDTGSVWESNRALRVGRMRELEVSLADDSVSRQHAEVTLTGDGWVARDLGSTNGTFVNGVRIGRVGQRVRD